MQGTSPINTSAPNGGAGTAVRIQSGNGTSSVGNGSRVQSNDHILIREQSSHVQTTKNQGKSNMILSHGNTSSMYANNMDSYVQNEFQ